MVGTVQFDAEVIQRIKDLLLEDKGSIVIERILQEEVKDPKSPIYQMDIPGYGGIERSIKPKFQKNSANINSKDLASINSKGSRNSRFPKESSKHKFKRIEQT